MNKDIAKMLFLDTSNLGHTISREESLKIADETLQKAESERIITAIKEASKGLQFDEIEASRGLIVENCDNIKDVLINLGDLINEFIFNSFNKLQEEFNEINNKLNEHKENYENLLKRIDKLEKRSHPRSPKDIKIGGPHCDVCEERFSKAFNYNNIFIDFTKIKKLNFSENLPNQLKDLNCWKNENR